MVLARPFGWLRIFATAPYLICNTPAAGEGWSVSTRNVQGFAGRGEGRSRLAGRLPDSPDPPTTRGPCGPSLPFRPDSAREAARPRYCRLLLPPTTGDRLPCLSSAGGCPCPPERGWVRPRENNPRPAARSKVGRPPSVSLGAAWLTVDFQVAVTSAISAPQRFIFPCLREFPPAFPEIHSHAVWNLGD